MNPYLTGALISLVIWTSIVDLRHDARLTALEAAPAPVATPQPFQGEFAAERIAGRVRTHCEWKERTERTASLHCVYVKPNGKKPSVAAQPAP